MPAAPLIITYLQKEHRMNPIIFLRDYLYGMFKKATSSTKYNSELAWFVTSVDELNSIPESIRRIVIGVVPRTDKYDQCQYKYAGNDVWIPLRYGPMSKTDIRTWMMTSDAAASQYRPVFK